MKETFINLSSKPKSGKYMVIEIDINPRPDGVWRVTRPDGGRPPPYIQK